MLQKDAKIFFLKESGNIEKIRKFHESGDPEEKRAPPGASLLHSTDEELPFNMVKVTGIKKEGRLQDLGLGYKHNISIVVIKRTAGTFLHPGADMHFEVDDEVGYGCEDCKWEVGKDRQPPTCQCFRLHEYIDFVSLGIQTLPMQYYIVPAHLDKACFGKEAIRGASQAIDFGRTQNLRIVAAEMCMLENLTHRLKAAAVTDQEAKSSGKERQEKEEK